MLHRNKIIEGWILRMTNYLHMPPSVGILTYIIFAPAIFVIEEVVMLKDTFLVTEKINEIKQEWADSDGSEEGV